MSRDERRRMEKYKSKKEKAVETVEAEKSAKEKSTPTGKRKCEEVISPTGHTPKNKATNKGTCIFDILSKSYLSHKINGHGPH